MVAEFFGGVGQLITEQKSLSKAIALHKELQSELAEPIKDVHARIARVTNIRARIEEAEQALARLPALPAADETDVIKLLRFEHETARINTEAEQLREIVRITGARLARAEQLEADRHRARNQRKRRRKKR